MLIILWKSLTSFSSIAIALGQVCQSFPGILSNKNKAQKTYVDILFGYLQYQWEIWTQNYGTDCDHLSGDMFTKFISILWMLLCGYECHFRMDLFLANIEG